MKKFMLFFTLIAVLVFGSNAVYANGGDIPTPNISAYNGGDIPTP